MKRKIYGLLMCLSLVGIFAVDLLSPLAAHRPMQPEHVFSYHTAGWLRVFLIACVVGFAGAAFDLWDERNLRLEDEQKQSDAGRTV